MSELKTQENEHDVDAFLSAVENPGRREDALALRDMMERVTGCPAKMWGTSIVGFDRYEYVQKNGKPAGWMITGFAPRKSNLVVYIMPGFSKYGEILDRLGPHKHAKSCLYLSRLSKVDAEALEELVARSVEDMRTMYS
jgi:Domain of unknown function (DU1801)